MAVSVALSTGEMLSVPGFSPARQRRVRRLQRKLARAKRGSARGTAQAPSRNVRQQAGLNRGILASCWGLIVRRLQDKAPGRVEKVSPAYTSQGMR